ncbi:MAG TPA: hypothetical protein VFG68_02965, partial [Fimbriiglobus sp.]|nr:hypothetical protein [Fimbriiglobus sp.]
GSLISFALASGGTNEVVFGATLAVGAIIPGLGDLGLTDTHVSFAFDSISTDTFDLDISTAAGMSGVAFTQFLKLNPQALFDKLDDLRDKLNAIGGVIGLDIPFLNTTIDRLLNISDVIDTRVVRPLGFDFAGVAGRVANFRTAQDLAQVLSAGLTNVGENVTNQVLVNLEDLGFQFQDGELTYQLEAKKFFSLTGQAIDFDLNLPEGLAGLEVDGVINLNIEATVQITLGIDLETLSFTDLDSLLDALFIRDASITATADFEIPDLDATARIGFIEVEVQNGRVETNDLSVSIGLEDPDNSDGKNQITLRELIDTITSSPLDLIGDPVLGGTVDIVLPLAVPSVPSLGIATASDATTLTVHADLSTDPITYDVELPPIVTTIQKILDFDNMSAADMVGMLQQVVDLLIAMTNGKALQTPIPFTDKTVGDVLEFGKSFKAEFLDPLFVSGDALKPDADGDGDYDLNFNTIQGLVQTLADKLGIPVTVVYDQSKNDFTFNLEFDRSLGFGEAVVTEKVRGGGGLNEQQTVRIDAVTDSILGDSFKLGFPDATGKTIFTAAIPVGSTAAVVKSKLEALSGIGTGNVLVGLDGSVYTITFQGTLANTDVPQLAADASQLTKEFALDLGASLGDFAGLTTSGGFRIASELKANLTFGVDLDPVVGIQITPEVFQPKTGEIDVTVVTEGKPAAGADPAVNEIVTVTVNLTPPLDPADPEPTFRLAFRQTPGTGNFLLTAPIPRGADASAVRTALGNLTGFAATDFDVTKASGAEVYTITFVGTLAGKDVELASDDGILSGNAVFSVRVNNLGAPVLDGGGNFQFVNGNLVRDPSTPVNATPISITVLQSATLDNASLEDLAKDVQAALDAAIRALAVPLTLGFSSIVLTPASGTVTAPADSLVEPDNDLRVTLTYDADTTDGEVGGVVISAVLRQARLLGNTSLSALADELEATLNAALAPRVPGVTVTVGTSGGKLTFVVSGLSGDKSLTLSAASLVVATAGGGKIALSAPSVTALPGTDPLDAPVVVDRVVLVDIPAGFNDPAFQGLGLLGTPTPLNGRLTDKVEFTLEVLTQGGTVSKTVSVSMPASVTSTNTSIDDLVADLNAALAAALTTAGLATDLVTAERIDSEGNRIRLISKSGAVSQLAITVPATVAGGGANGAITGLGFAETTSQEGAPLKARATEFFIENANFKGLLSITTKDVSATATLGFLGLKATVTDGPIISIGAGFDIMDPVQGDKRVSVDVLAAALRGGKFLFDAANVGGTNAEPGTGIVAGAVTGGVDFKLAIEPTGAISGLDELDTSLDVRVSSPNWLLAPPTFQDPLGFGGDPIALTATPTALASVAPANGKLTADLSFVVSQGTFEAVGFLKAADTATFTTRAKLQTALQDAIDDALVRLDVANGAASVGAITVGTNAAGAFTLIGATDLSVRGNVIKFNFQAPNIEALLDRFRDLSLSDIIAGLRIVVDFLDDLPAVSNALQFKIPVINLSVRDLLDVAGDFADTLDRIEADPAGSLQLLETVLRDQLNIPTSVPQILSYDVAENVIAFDLTLGSHTSLSRPFSLDLDGFLPDFLSQIVGVSASGTVGVSAGAALTLKLGLDLDTKTFFLFTDDASTTGVVEGTQFNANASASGSGLDFTAQLGPFGLFVIGGSASLSGTFEAKLNDDGDGRLVLVSLGAGGPASELSNLVSVLSLTPNGAAEVALPLFIGTRDNPLPIDVLSKNHNPESPNNVLSANIDLDKLILGQLNPIQVTLPDFNFSNIQVPSLFALLSDPATLVDGLDRVLDTLQDTLSGQIFGVKLPLIGDALKDNPVADLIENFRDDLLQPLANLLRENNVTINGLIDLLKGQLFDVFNGLGLLKDGPDAGTDITVDDILVRFLDAAGNPTNILLADSLQFDFDLEKTFTFPGSPVAFNLGIPAIGISGMLEPEITVDFDLHFGFGVDKDLGFYFVTDHTDGSGNPIPELSAIVNIDFTQSLADKAFIEGQLLFLALGLTDGVDINGDGLVLGSGGPVTNRDTEDFTRIFLQATLDIKDPGAGPKDDGKLTLSELVSSPITQTFAPAITGGAALRLHGVVDFGAIDPALANVLPKIETDVLADFGFSLAPGTGFTLEPPRAALANVTLDLGSFISGFAGDILRSVANVLGPLDWLIGPDGFLNKRIPLLSDLAGKTITGKDLIAIFDPKNGPKVVKFLNFVEQLYFFIDLVRDAPAEGTLKLNFGDLVLAGDFSGVPIIDKPISLSLPGGGAVPDLTKVKNLRDLKLPGSLAPPSSPPLPSKVSKFTSGVTGEGSIDFPILKPENIFKLLMGQPDVTLVLVELPEFGFDFFYRQSFPIIGPLVGTFGGGVGGGVDMGFGYDTRGLSQFIATKNPANLLSGFFLNDLDPATGTDRAEAFLRAQIAVGAALSLGFASVGVEGGIEATIFFNLADLDNDGKIRFDEMGANLAANDFNPLAVFDISGLVELFMRAYFEIDLGFFSIKKTFEFARLKLFEFDIPFERPSILASVSDGVLTLNIGPNSAARLRGDITDIAESITVESVGSDIIVYSNALGVDRATAMFFKFSGVTKIIADGGLGDDTIDLSLVTGNVIAEVHGGEGDDTIKGTDGTAADQLFGDGGEDTIFGRGGPDVIRGGADDDDLSGDGGADQLFGEEGDDTLDGGADVDALDGGPGDNTFTRSLGADDYNLFNFGSVVFINGALGDPVLDFSDKTQGLTFFVRADQIEVGFDLIPGQDGLQIGDFNSQVIVTNPSGVTGIIGGDAADVFYVASTAGPLNLNGGKGDDRYVFEAGTGTITATVADTGNPWDSDNRIEVLGASAAEEFVITASAITFGAHVINYAAGAADGSVTQILLDARGGNDTIRVKSTSEFVPVRAAGGPGDDRIEVGGDGANGLDNIRSYARTGLNKSRSPDLTTVFGLGPVVLVGGAGHDSIVLDDSLDPDAETGNITAFTEARDGGLTVEVGVVSGLGMKLTDPALAGVQRGRAEFEGFEVVQVLLGQAADTFTVGGDSIFPELPVNR